MNRDERIAHLVACVAEEAGEIAQAAGKILRFGLFDRHPKRGNIDNLTLLVKEVNDLLACMEMLDEMGLNCDLACSGMINAKKERVEEYILYAEKAKAKQAEVEASEKAAAEKFAEFYVEGIKQDAARKKDAIDRFLEEKAKQERPVAFVNGVPVGIDGLITALETVMGLVQREIHESMSSCKEEAKDAEEQLELYEYLTTGDLIKTGDEVYFDGRWRIIEVNPTIPRSRVTAGAKVRRRI